MNYEILKHKINMNLKSEDVFKLPL